MESQFSPYFHRYFRDFFGSPFELLKYEVFCRHLFQVTESANKRVLDVGCGFGITSMYLGALGAFRVVGVDHNKEKISLFQKILSRFEPPLTNVEVKLQDAISLGYEDNAFDIVVAIETISHVRDLDALLSETRRVLARRGILYVQDGNNSLNVLTRSQRRRFWKRLECGPVDDVVFRGTERPLPYIIRRGKIIRENFPDLDSAVVNQLARDTAGLFGDQITAAVEKYLREGRAINKPEFRFRNPDTGEYPEYEFNPFSLKRKLEKLGFSASLLKPYFYGGYPILPGKGVLRNLLACIQSRGILAFHPLSVLIAPSFRILARKRN